MKKKGLVKKLSAALFATVMIISAFSQLSTQVFAADTTNELPTVEQFATVEQLKSFNTNDNDGEINPAVVYFGRYNQQWWIAGSQQENGLTLFSKNLFETGQSFEPDWQNNKMYSDDWNCTYLNGSPTKVDSNHYGASTIRAKMKNMETTYFSNAQQNLMNTTKIYTKDSLNKSIYYTTDKLYLAYGDLRNPKYITVGANSSDILNNGLRIDRDYWGTRSFWLRTPDSDIPHFVYVAEESFDEVYYVYVLHSYALMPAFELNLSSVLFASAVPAVSYDGKIQESDTYTLRCKPENNIGTVTISKSKHSLTVNGVTNDSTYLVVQNKDGAWSKKVSSNDLIFADEMSDTLTSFENCEVWLETTDADDRLTYAQKAIQGTEYNVKVTADENMMITSNNGIQTSILNSIENIIVKAGNDYIFPTDYTVEEQNGIKVTRNSENQITVSGTPTDDVNMRLPQPIKKEYNMVVKGDGTFTETCIGYKPIVANEFAVKNNGNVGLENVKVEITGTNADKFDLNWDETATIQPNETIVLTVKPKDNLPVNKYQATLSVTADKVNTLTTNLQFAVNEHNYDIVVTPPTCTEKGYTTYTCKNCSYSYAGNEVNAKGHTFGEWEIIDSPTCEQSGSRKHTCTVCGFSETENLNPNGHIWEDDYTVDKEPTCAEDGSKSVHCKNCNAVKDSTTIAKLGHSFTNYVSDDNATCTENGTETAKCEHCDKTDTRIQENSALGHKLGEWEVIKEPTTAETGTKERHCERCGYTETEVIPMVSEPNQSTENNTDKDNFNSDTSNQSPKTGIQTNVGLFTSVFTVSALGIFVLTVFKKKKVLDDN